MSDEVPLLRVFARRVVAVSEVDAEAHGAVLSVGPTRLARACRRRLDATVR
jgi:hypothetical protein